MAEYISKEDLIKAIEDAGADVIADYGDYDCESGFSRDNLSQIINSIPTADVEPVRHGKWIRKVENDGYAMSLCSDCSFPVHIYWGESKFCPACGAKMDLED